MYNRILAFFSVFMVLICVLMLNVYSISQGGELHDAAINQNTYRLNVAKLRGNIYDCRRKPITGAKKTNVAAVAPCIESANALAQAFSGKDGADILNMCKSGKPFALNLGEKELDAQGIDIFKVPVRYTMEQPCAHLIGYLDGSNHGVSGIEKAYDEFLASGNGNISVKYQVDALDRLMPGEEKVVEDNSYLQTRGVVLTIDSRLQEISEKIAKQNIKNGAVIISEVPSCKVRALVSLPTFSPIDVEKSLNDPACPLINRAFSPYNVGSVFKLLIAAAALDEGISPESAYECAGSCDVDGHIFHCFNSAPHGAIDMKDAIAYSCNTYFIELSKNMNAENLLNMVDNLGFGQKYELAPGLFSESGVLPDKNTLLDKKQMANFSFGQGSLLATPIQITGLINAIAADGYFTHPSIVEGLVNENLEFVNENQNIYTRQVFSRETAQILKECMKASVNYGTSQKGKPSHKETAAKTSTAETGLKINGEDVIQTWYAGFYPAEQPRYCIVVLSENGVGGGESCGPVFKGIIDEIEETLPGSLLP